MNDLSKADWSDPERVRNLMSSYGQRYGEVFWKSLYDLIGGSPRRLVLELGCGPGLFLADSVRRLGAAQVYGLDASEEMLSQAREVLSKVLPKEGFQLKQVDFDRDSLDTIPVEADLVFAGYILHEVANPTGLVKAARHLLKPDGVHIVFDFVSGNPDAFIRSMTSRGMSEEVARKRYPHMCKHSVQDLQSFFHDTGYVDIKSSVVDGFRAIVMGMYAAGGPSSDTYARLETQHKHSPWAFDESRLVCPSCGSHHILRVVDRAGALRGTQVFECKSCGRKFYDRDVDDYRPTF